MSRGEPVLRTARMVLTPVTDADAAPLHAHWNHPLVRRHLWDDEPVDHAAVAAVTATSEADFRRAGYGMWALRRRDASGADGKSDDLIGVCGLRRGCGTTTVGRTETTVDVVEIVFSVDRAHWGHSLATEAARAVLDYAFTDVGLDRVVGGADPSNGASLSVLHRLGMHPTAPLTIDGRTYPYYASYARARDVGGRHDKSTRCGSP